MILKVFVFVGMVGFSMPSLAAYRCELFDRAENAPGGEIPVKVLFTDSNDVYAAKQACSALVDRKNVVDYWLKWISPSALPKDWRLFDLLPQTSKNNRIIVETCEGKIRFNPKNNSGSGSEGGKLTVTGTVKESENTKKIDTLTMRLFVPGFEIGDHEYIHSATLDVSQAKVSKVTQFGRDDVNVIFDFAPGSTIDFTTEGSTETAMLEKLYIGTGAGESLFFEITYQTSGGFVRTESYSIESRKGCSIRDLN